MNCKKCGFLLSGNDQFCKNCGAPVNAQSNINSSSQSTINQQSQTYQSTSNMQPNYSNNNINNNPNNWQGGYNNNFNMQPKQSNAKKYIIIILSAILVVIASIQIYKLVTTVKENTPNSNYNSGQVTQTGNSSYNLNYKGYTFNMPNDVVAEETSGGLLLANEAKGWIVNLMIEEGSYEKLISNKSRITSLVEADNKCKVKSIDEKKLGGINYLTVETEMQGAKVLMAFAKLDASHIYLIVAMNASATIDYKTLESVAPILSSAKAKSASNSIATNNDIKLEGILELAK